MIYNKIIFNLYLLTSMRVRFQQTPHFFDIDGRTEGRHPDIPAMAMMDRKMLTALVPPLMSEMFIAEQSLSKKYSAMNPVRLQMALNKMSCT